MCGPDVLWEDERLAAPHAADDKALRVRQMFDRIAPTYQRVNRVASGGRDAAWRRRLIRMAEVRRGERILDVACGTGDLAELFAAASGGPVVGADFALQMLRSAPQSVAPWVGCQADALALPFVSESFDIVSCAFGIRNFQDLKRGLSEAHRVLRPGGRAMILEFAMPRTPVIRQIYGFYFRSILPRIAAWLSRDRSGAYHYLPRSVMTFASPAEITQLLKDVGFSQVTVKALTCGVVHAYRADKA
jgi:demethylmenaquinone methyltransferase/2-methoxy-6-polyprenyl-1,4-benzoquinol methylase